MDDFLDEKTNATALGIAGGKALNLYLMQQAGAPVPKWFALPVHYFNQVYADLKASILAEIQKVSLSNLDSLKACAQNIEELFLKTELSPEFKAEIKARISSDKSYAVRSSAAGEDGEKNSYAGQLASFLNCKNDEIFEAILKVWASIFSERNIQYRILNEIHSTPEVGVVIQELIEVQSSGVMFTAHPLLKEGYLDQVVINAGYGLGEGVVTDQVEVDSYIYSKSQKKLIEHKHALKKHMMVSKATGPGLELIAVDSSKENISVLSHTQISELVSFGLRLEKFYQVEQDIEWCVDKNGKIYLTQTRPITTLLKGTNKLDFLFDNSNIVESFPGVNTPWTLGQVKDIYRVAFKRTCLRLGFGRRRVNENSFLFASLLGMYRGRVYLNLTHWYAMMRMIPYTDGYIKSWEESLGVEIKNESSSTSSFQDLFRAINVFSRGVYFLLSLDFYLRKLDQRLQATFQEFWEQEKSHKALTPAEAINELEAFKAKMFEDSEFTLINDIFAFAFTSITKKLIQKWTVLEPDETFNRLLFGRQQMDSIKPLLSLQNLIKLVNENEKLKSALVGLVEEKDFKIELLQTIPNSGQFLREFNEHLDLYGDRGVNELKLETVTFRENPKHLIELILSFKQHDNGQDHTKNEEIGDIPINGKFKKLVFQLCLKLAIRSIVYRENFRLNRTRMYGVIRRMTNNLGHKLNALGAIDNPRDIYFLDKEDLYQFYSGLSFDFDLKSIVLHKKQLFYQYQKVEVFNRYTFRQGKLTEIKPEFVSSKHIKGTGCAAGRVSGEAIVIRELGELAKDVTLVKDKILVAQMTDPGWVFLMANAKGLLVEKGSLLSHTAIIGRELGIPTIVGASNATEIIKTGDQIELDAHTGVVRILND